jgi:hypothetical protein
MMVSILVGIGLLYVYFVNLTIHNVVARTNAQKQIVELSSSVSELESEYIAIENKITLEVAYSKGFEDATPKKFISRDQALTYNYR